MRKLAGWMTNLYLHWWTFMQGSLARWHLRKRGLKACPQWSAAPLRALAHPHKHVLLHGLFSLWATEMRQNSCSSPAPFPQQARSRTRAVSSEGLAWLYPSLESMWSKYDTGILWGPRARAVPEQCEYRLALSHGHSLMAPEVLAANRLFK